MAAGEELSRLEELLRRPDFVLEPSVKDSVRQYIKAGGKPEDILESLSEGYVGYAHMAMLMVKWMEYVDDEPSTSHDEFHYLKEFAKSKFDPDKFISVFGSHSTRSQGLAWLDGLLSDPRGRKLIYELSAAHRNSLLLNFAIQKIMKMGYQDEVAAAGSGLASYFSVFHKLLANKVAALLAVVRKAAEAEVEAQAAGEAGEAAAGRGPEAAAARGHVRTPTMGQMRARAHAQREVAALVKELKDSCEHSQHTYLHVQHVLHHLASQPGGEALLAVAQQLEVEVAAGSPSLPVWSMQKLYAPPGCPPAQVEACGLIGKMLQTGPNGAIANDVMRLYSLYVSGGGGGGGGSGGARSADGREEAAGSGAPGGELSVAPLQHPRLVQALLACIFTPGRPPSHELLAASANLLARATCTRPRPLAPRRDTSKAAAGSSQQPQPQPHSSDDGDEQMEEAQEEREGEREREAERVAETTQALQWAVGLLSRPHGRFTEEDAGMAQQVPRLPVVAHGLLHAVSCQLGSPAFYEDPPAVAAALPSLLRISLVVAEGQPQLASKVLSTWSVALTELPRAGLGELCRLVLDGCVVLMRDAAAAAADAAAGDGGGSGGSGGSGDVIQEVLQMVEGWSRQGGADSALLRHFVLQVLAFFGPPYSADFSGRLLRLLVAAGVRSHVRNDAAAALLREFAAAVDPAASSSSGSHTPLTSRELHVLGELAAAGLGVGGGAAPGGR